MILENIKKDSIRFRKERNPIGSFLSTLAAEAAMVGKNNGNRESTDAEVVKVLTKFANNLTETINLLEKNGRSSDKEKQELEVVESYLPTMMTQEELQREIDSLKVEMQVSTKRDMGKIMGVLKAKFDGKYDGKMASELVKNSLD